MKNSSKKSIQQIQNAKQAVLGKSQMNQIKGGSDGDGTDGADYIGVLDIIDG
ncbi:MAG: hypothetical protein ACI9RM_002257 [Ulvibacter sp.]|jgi:hypothetical protein